MEKTVNLKEVIKDYKNQEFGISDICEKHNICRTTLYNKLKELGIKHRKLRNNWV